MKLKERQEKLASLGYEVVNRALWVRDRSVFSTNFGTNVTLAGGTTKQVIVVNANVALYIRSLADMQWSAPIKEKLKKDNTDLSFVFSKAAVKAMLKDKLFAQ